MRISKGQVWQSAGGERVKVIEAGANWVRYEKENKMKDVARTNAFKKRFSTLAGVGLTNDVARVFKANEIKIKTPEKVVDVEIEQLTAADILEDAIKTMQQRGQAYDKQGEQERSMPKIVEMFNALTGHELSVVEGWQFMTILKMVRAANGYNADSYLDGAAYFALAGEEAALEHDIYDN